MTQSIQRQIATLSSHRASSEMVPMQKRTRKSLPGLSRYLAACEQRFLNTTLVISDMDLIPLPSLKDYLQQRLQMVPPTTIGVDFVYPHTAKYFMGAQLGKQPVTERHYTRTPRFRSCYLMGKGHLFRRVFQIQDNVKSVLDLMASVYDDSHISIAYSTVRRQDHTIFSQKKVEHYLKEGPCVSYDEILFGKMAVAQGDCTWNATSLDYRTSRCLHFEQRSMQQYPMVGESGTPFNCYKYPNNSIDIHASRRRNISTCVKQLAHHLHIKKCPEYYTAEKWMTTKEYSQLVDILIFINNLGHISSFVLNEKNDEILYPVWLNTECEDANTLQYMTLKDRTNYRFNEKVKMCGKSKSYYAQQLLEMIQQKWIDAKLINGNIYFPDSQIHIKIEMRKDNNKRDHGWNFCTTSINNNEVFFSKRVRCIKKRCKKLHKTLVLNEEFYVTQMHMILDTLNKRIPNKLREFSGLKDNALVFWRNYPEYINIDSIVGTYRNIHLLNISAMQREQSKLCNVIGGPKPNTVYCDKIHYCIGTVQRSWNFALARAVLNNGTQTDLAGKFVFSNTTNLNYTNCNPTICNGFSLDPRYTCNANHSERMYKYMLTNQPQFKFQEIVLAFQSKKICFFGDSLSAGHAETLENTIRLHGIHSSVSNNKIYFLNNIRTHGKLYTSSYDLYADKLHPAMKKIDTCDIIVLNTALFWNLETDHKRSKFNIGRIIKDDEIYYRSGNIFKT